MVQESLNRQFAELHAHRVATMDPAALAVNVNQRRELVDAADESRFLQVGDLVPAFALREVDGGEIVSEELLARGPVVLVFFRFATCPACNIALPYYKRQLFPGLAALGASLVGVSPQVPEKLRDIKHRHELPFPVASDTDNALGRSFGIVFTANAESQASALAKGNDLGEVTGTGTWDLPMPAVIVIGQDRVARYVNVSPDWLVRAEADEVLEAVRALAGQYA